MFLFPLTYFFFFSFCSLQGRVTEIVHRAFWDSLQEQLSSDPPNYNHAVILLHEVKTVSVCGIRLEVLAEGQGLMRHLTTSIQNQSIYLTDK